MCKWFHFLAINQTGNTNSVHVFPYQDIITWSWILIGVWNRLYDKTKTKQSACTEQWSENIG